MMTALSLWTGRHARAAAVRYAGALIEDEAPKLKPGVDWRLEVTDDAGSVLYQLRFIVAASFADRSHSGEA